MWNSGPACIDSELTFFAHLRPANADPEPISGSLTYLWITDVGHYEIDVVESDSNANLTKLFSRFQVPHSGQYSIEVFVFNFTDPSFHGLAENTTLAVNLSDSINDSIAQATNNFTLTEKFHIRLKLSQNVTRQKHWGPEEFAARIPVDVEVEVIDRFVEPLFSFIWQVDGQTTFTEMSHMELVFNSTAENYIKVFAIALFNMTDSNKTSYSVSRESTKVRKRLTIKDLITNVRLAADHRAFIDEEFKARFTCNGSGPFDILWNITGPFNDSAIYEGAFLNSKSCDYLITHYFTELGSYVLTVSVENPIDLQKRNFDIDATTITVSTLPPDQVSAIVPVFSVIIAVVIVIALLWSYFSTQRTTQIETADFEFYSPMISIRSKFSGNKMSCVYHKIKDFVRHLIQRKQSQYQEGVELQLLSNRYGTMGLLQLNRAH